MGTPDFAVPSLTALYKNGYNVTMVVTQPDRPKGRGCKLMPPPVKEAALCLGYEVTQPVSIRDDRFNDQITGCGADLFIVVAFGHILPKPLLELPRTGTINIHASILPKYRGPAPIQWAIINGEKETGVTTIFLDGGLDTGDILLSEIISIGPEDTSSILHDRLSVLGADLLIRTLKGLEAGDIKPLPQDHTRATYAPLLKKKDGHINWKMPAEKIDAFIRGMTPWPGSFTFYENKRLKIFKAKQVCIDVDEPPGTVIKRFPDELYIATGKGALSVMEVQGESGKRLFIKDFLRGSRICPGSVLD